MDDERKQLMAAVAEFAALLRRSEPPGESRLALGRIMREHGLEQRHVGALLTVALYGPLTISELAARHHVTLKTSSLVAVQLEAAGLVERREDPADRRRTIVQLAKARERAVREGLEHRSAHLGRALERLTPAQRDGLLTGLRVLSEEMARERE